MERISPDAICKTCGVFRSVSGSPAVRSGLAIVTDVPVSMVMRHHLSHIRPSAFRLPWPCFGYTLSVYRGGGSDGTDGFYFVSSSRFCGIGRYFSGKCFREYPCLQSLLIWPTSPHDQQTDRSILLYSLFGEHGPMGALILYTQAAAFRLAISHAGFSTSVRCILSSRRAVSTSVFTFCTLLLSSSRRFCVPRIQRLSSLFPLARSLVPLGWSGCNGQQMPGGLPPDC